LKFWFVRTGEYPALRDVRAKYDIGLFIDYIQFLKFAVKVGVYFQLICIAGVANPCQMVGKPLPLQNELKKQRFLYISLHP
jgi:hypothetical protein